MSTGSEISLGSLLKRSDEQTIVSADALYQEVTIKLWGKGVIRRGVVAGRDVTTPRRVVRHNQLILSKIDARHGAIGLVPPELDGAIVSNDFPSFTIEEGHILPEFLGWLVRSKMFIELCKQSSEGTTNRVRLKEQRFLDQSIFLPSKGKQQELVELLNNVARKSLILSITLDSIESDAEKLLAVQFRQLIADAPYKPMVEVAPLVRREVTIAPEASYTELGVRSFFKGTFHRRKVDGTEFTWQDMYWIKQGDLIFSNIMAWEKAIAIAKVEDEGCVGGVSSRKGKNRTLSPDRC